MNAPVTSRPGDHVRHRAIIFGALAGILALAIAALVINDTLRAYNDAGFTAAKQLGQPGQTAREGRKLAKALLWRDPLNARLLGALALSDQKAGNTLEANRLANFSGDLSWRDGPTDALLLQNALSRNNLKSGVQRADALLRVEPKTEPVLFPILTQVAMRQAGADAIAQQLALKPPWRWDFLASLNANADPETAFAVLSRLQATSAPPIPEESARYVQRLTSLKRYDQAFLAVLLFLPKEKLKYFNNIFNGTFDDVTGIEPFDWTLNSASGVSVAVEDYPGRPNNRALHLLYSGTDRTEIVSQLLAMPPGKYILTGRTQATAPGVENDLNWIIHCLDGADILHLASPPAPDWIGFSQSFEVPDNCPAQLLTLTSQPSDRSTNLEAWYDDLAIQRSAEQ